MANRKPPNNHENPIPIRNGPPCRIPGRLRPAGRQTRCGDRERDPIGGRAGDGGDDTKAFVAAVNAIQSGNSRHLLIPPGRYHLTAGGNPKRPDVLFPFANLDGLEIEGTGAELMVAGVTR